MIKVSDKAYQQIKLRNQDLIINLVPQGCAGSKFTFTFGSKPEIDFISLLFPDFIIYCPISVYSILKDGYLDIESDLSGISFTFKSPLERSRCGCGISVQI